MGLFETLAAAFKPQPNKVIIIGSKKGSTDVLYLTEGKFWSSHRTNAYEWADKPAAEKMVEMLSKETNTGVQNISLFPANE